MKSVKSRNPTKSPACSGASLIQTIYDIIKVHGGEIKVETKAEEGLPAEASSGSASSGSASLGSALAEAGSEFIIQLAYA